MVPIVVPRSPARLQRAADVVLYYALGGGLGHITRARHVLAALGDAARATLLTASSFALDARVTGGLPVVHVPDRLGRSRDDFASWLEGLLDELGQAHKQPFARE